MSKPTEIQRAIHSRLDEVYARVKHGSSDDDQDAMTLRDRAVGCVLSEVNDAISQWKADRR